MPVKMLGVNKLSTSFFFLTSSEICCALLIVKYFWGNCSSYELSCLEQAQFLHRGPAFIFEEVTFFPCITAFFIEVGEVKQQQ